MPFRWSVYYLSCCNIIRECIERARRKEEKSRGMYQAVNENFESKDFWQPDSQIGRLEKVAAFSRSRLLVDKMIVWRTILGLIMASKWPPPESQSACRFSTTDAEGSRSTQNKLRDARSYAKSPRQDCINWAMSMAACDSAADLPRVTRGRRLRRCDERKVRSCTLRILWQLFVAVEILLLPSRWPMTAPSKPGWYLHAFALRVA